MTKNVDDMKVTKLELAEATEAGNFKAVGSSGTKLFGDVYDEEYLIAMEGTDRADEYDKIVRSDDTVTMLLTAVKNPIMRASWDIEPAAVKEGRQEKADRIAEHVKHELFERSPQDFKDALEDSLSFIEHGYSLHERVHEKVEDPEFGKYIGLKKIAWRSQRTIERWNLNKDGSIKEVYQQADGDLGDAIWIDGRFVTVFSNRKKGDNYEGISALRPIFGNLQRKNMFLKLLAIGIERYAINTPVGQIPMGKENNQEEVAIFKEMLKAISSHQQNYFTLPHGWEVEFLKNPFDVDKVVKAIVREDEGMVKSFVANHLNLGGSGAGGAYSLGNDFSDMFLSIIENYADIIVRRYNKEIIKEFVDLNYGKQSVYPKLVVSGINNKFGAEFAEIIKKMIDAKAITATTDIEIRLRELLGLPELTEKQLKIIPDIRKEEPDVSQDPVTNISEDNGLGKFQESSESLILTEFSQDLEKLNSKIHGQLVSGQNKTEKVMTQNLNSIFNKMVKDLSSKLASVKPDKRSKVIRDYKFNSAGFGVDTYLNKLVKVQAELASVAVTQVKNETNSRNSLFAEGLKSRITLGELDKIIAGLPVHTQDVLLTDTQLIVNGQITDISNSILLSASGSIEETTDIKTIKEGLMDAQSRKIHGTGKSGVNQSITTGAGNLSAKTYNTARTEFFSQEEILAGIDAFMFSNADPKTPICKDLNGRIFEATDDFTYFPPLHHLCKSYIVPLFDVPKGVNVSSSLKPSKKSLDKFKTL